ncbi:MAG: hypothetical protein GY724_14315 [Actinomycetia bacterium]|nr:hypothetical protein [Actinomycetes bacterium]
MRSRLRDIPDDRQDFAVVLDFDGIYELVPSGTAVARADGLKQAAAMIFVDVRPVFIDVNLDLPCQGHVERRTVTVRFQSQVVAPELVLQDRIERLQNKLEYWTRSLVARESAQYTVDDHDRFENAARQTIVHRLLEHPPASAAAIALQLVEVSAELPEGTKSHKQHLIDGTRDTERRIHDAQEDEKVARLDRERVHATRLEETRNEEDVWRARQPLEDEKREKEKWQLGEDAQQLEEAYRRGPEAVLAVMAARDPEFMQQLVAHGVEDRNFLANLLLRAADSGVVNRGVVEDLLTDAANQLLQGSGAQIGTGDVLKEIDNGSQRGPNAEADADRDDEGFDPEDDDFDDRLIEVIEGEDDVIAAMFGTETTNGDQPPEGGPLGASSREADAEASRPASTRARKTTDPGTDDGGGAGQVRANIDGDRPEQPPAEDADDD